MALSRRRAPRVLACLFTVLLSLPAGAAGAANPDSVAKPALQIRKASAPIVLAGDLSDAGWQGIEPISTWYETNVGDNVEPQVKNLAWLAYDESNFYAGFRFDDPTPHGIRAPL